MNDIEKYGVAEFNAKCRESVLRNVSDFTTMTSRMGYWVDFDKAYWTMNPSYVESVWWSLKEIHKKAWVFHSNEGLDLVIEFWYLTQQH